MASFLSDIRTGKTVNGVAHTYLLEGSVILQETWSGNCLMPMYDSMGEVCGIVHNSAGYYFRKNLQGDVIAIVDSTLTTVAEYTYDAWGKILKITDENGCDITDPNGYACCVEFPNAEHIAHINPFRYRSYYYDADTSLYYLQSRYYDPETGRFLNADDVSYLDPEDLSAINLYAYCGNDPVMYSDGSGYAPEWLQDLAIGLAIVGTVLVVGAVTALTMGVGTNIMATTMAGAIIHGAAVGTLIGAGIGVTAGGIIGGAVSDWSAEGILIGMGIGLGGGAIVGAIAGGSIGAYQYTSAVHSWYGGKEKMISHFIDHGKKEGYKNVIQYTKSAKNVIKKGTYVAQKNAYLVCKTTNKFYYVGVAKNSTLITTYFTKTLTKTSMALLGLI